MSISFENNPYLYYVVADDEEAARYRMLAAASDTLKQTRKMILYPGAWDLMCAKRLAIRSDEMLDEFSIAFQEIAGVDLVAGKLLYNDRVIQLFGEQRAADRFKALAYYLSETGVEVVHTFDYCLTSGVEARLVGIIPATLQRGFVHHVNLGGIYHWSWSRVRHKSGKILVACSISDTGLLVDPNSDSATVKIQLYRYEYLPLVSVTADWPNHQPTVKGLMRQLLIRSITKNEL